ncbi:hypothetical protein [Pseudomonas nitroreducens]|uniref:hypothetical protein n=1 Tax=Pseudomonas nitroreducens TaxID=46680 RepID=UPI00209E2F24|nr:hypothetical protein [Pseudomonas nitroreducens]MCP1621693.1 hypothetical protein [Pseudomonas nitroreducens]
MKKLLIAAIAASICTPVLAAPAQKNSQQPEHVQYGGNGKVKPLEQHEKTHEGGFFRDTVKKPIPNDAVVETGAHAGAEGAATAGSAEAGVATATVPAAGAGLGLSTPLVGSLTVGAAVGIGAAVVAVGAAIGNHGGGGGHHNSGTTGTTQ